MGLAASQSRYLFLTSRKADVEFEIFRCSTDKMQLTRQMSQLSQEYNSKLSQKKLAFYQDGHYEDINYNYLMGYGANYFTAFNHSKPLKDDNRMLLTDYKGQVVLSDAYAQAIMDVLGTSVMNAYGQGGTFDSSKIPEILAALCPPITADEFQNGVDSHEWNATTINALTGETTGSTVINSADQFNEKIDAILDLYYPIFLAASCNGWTTEYNEEMNSNTSYISDAVQSGTLVIASVDNYGQYESGKTLTYFLTTGALEQRNDSDAREALTAEYNAEKERISAEEEYLDLLIRDYSTEINAITTEIDSVKSLIQEGLKPFSWGTSG